MTPHRRNPSPINSTSSACRCCRVLLALQIFRVQRWIACGFLACMQARSPAVSEVSVKSAPHQSAILEDGRSLRQQELHLAARIQGFFFLLIIIECRLNVSAHVLKETPEGTVLRG